MKARLLKPKLGTYYGGQKLLFDEDIVAWLHKCRRDWILSEIRLMRKYARKSRIRIYKE